MACSSTGTDSTSCQEKDAEEGQAFAAGPTRVEHPEHPRTPVDLVVFFYRCSCGLDLNACHVQTFSFRAITTEDFRKQGPSTAQVEARWEQECCALSWFNLYLTPAKQVSKDAAGPSRRSNRKNKGRSNFHSLLICATSRNYSVGFFPLQGK